MAQQVIDQFRDASNQQLVDAGDSTNTAIRVNVVAGGGSSTGGGGVQYPIGTAPSTATGNVILGITTSGTLLTPTTVPFAHSTAIAVEIVDASGNQITAFGGGTTTVVGTVTTIPTGTQTVAQTGSPWGVSGTVTAIESGTWSVAVLGTATIAPTGTQTVAGTVTVTPSGTQTVAVSGTVPISGTVNITGTDTVVGTVTTVPSGTTTVAGTVAVAGGTSTATLTNLTSDQLDNDYALVVEDKRLRRLLEKIVIKAATEDEIQRRYAIGRVGPSYVSDQAWLEHRLERSGALVTADGHARYQEAVIRGNVFWAMAAGVTPSSLNATCSGLILYNPINSGVVCSIISAAMSFGVGLLSTNVNYVVRFEASGPNNAPPSGTTVSTINNALIGANRAGKAIAYSTATFAVAPSLSLTLQDWQVLGTYGTAAVTALTFPGINDIGGMLAVAPGGFINIGMSTNAVSGNLQLLWEEIPI